MSFTLSAKQVEVLSAAARHADRLLAIPPQFKGAVAQRLAAKLMAEGLAEEVKAKAGPTNWRRDAATGQAYALKLTAAGLKAVAVEMRKETEGVGADDTLAPTNARASRRMSRSRSDDVVRAESGGEKRGTNPDFTNTIEITLRAPRVGSKIDRVLGMLAPEKGATLAELIAATGWLPHTMRAALTGLRKRGFDVLLSRGDGASVYRATAPTRGSAR